MGAVRIVVQLVFEHQTDLHQRLEMAPHWIKPVASHLAHWVPEFQAPEPGNWLAWAVIIATIPAIMLVRNLLQYLSIYLTNWSAMHAIADIRTALFSHLQNLSLVFFNQASTGDLIARITNDTQVLYGIVGTSFASVVKDPITIFVLLGYQLVTNTTLTLISVVVFPVCVVPIVVYGRKVRKSARAVQNFNAELTNLMHESFTGNRVIKAYNLEETVNNQFRSTTGRYVGQLMRVVRSNEIPSQLMEIFGALGIALVFFYIQHAMRLLPPAQQPHETDFLTFVLTIVMIYPPVKSFTRLHNQVHQAKAASERVFELLAMKNTVSEPVSPKNLTSGMAGIDLQEVDFHYGAKQVLHRVSLEIKPGQLVALVGASGSGKTTLANLLLRFYDPSHGCIRIGGLDLRDIATRDLRNHIAVVAQENILFNDTIRRNIEMGRLGASHEEIVAAARHAHAYDFIMERPEGFDAVIGEKGVNLSGGQRQRIAIARAVLKNAPILILDEATSALDAESERAVQSALDGLMQGRTTICIAHRLSTIMHADRIVVLDQGRIVEMGTHDELLSREGAYQKLYRL